MTPGLWFAAPALAAIALFFFVPVAAGLGLSLTDFDLYALADPAVLRFVGARNYVELFQDPVVWTALRNTLVFVVVGAPLSVAVSLGAALLLQSRGLRAKGLFRTLLFLPVVTTLVAVAVVWRYLYHPRVGLLNHALGALGVAPVDWLGDPRFALASLIALAVWKNFGFNMVIFVAGLQAIPERLYEAARLDGASRAQLLRHVTLPMLVPTTSFVLVMTLIGHFQLFAEPYVMTQGGPEDATRSLVLLMYEQGFRWWSLGQAAALAFVLFALVLGVGLAARGLGLLRVGGGAEARA
ncbi:MAG TPA: sugar ABC transporter permease [Myxococcota bacterium]|nr:sugar ABC transporter permease [Myxococcota bacterium]